jgi:hypothetical protein
MVCVCGQFTKRRISSSTPSAAIIWRRRKGGPGGRAKFIIHGHATNHDDGVVPTQNFSFAERLQKEQAVGGPPVMIRIETSASLGAGTALIKVVEETADACSFLTKVFAMP